MPKSKKVVTKKSAKVEEVVMPVSPVMSEPVMKLKKPMMNSKFMVGGLIVIGIALLTYKFGPWVVPAVVDGKPITRMSVWTRMEKSYGTQTLDDMTNEIILDKAIARSGVNVERSKIDEQLATLEKQFESVGGLDAALTQRGLTKADLEKQVKTQLAVELILADKVVPTEDEIKKDFEENKTTLYKDKKYEDVKAGIESTLKESKLRDSFLTWFADVKKEAQVKTFGL